MIIDAEGEAHPLQTADYIYIDENEPHQLRNIGSDPFDFVCIVPRRGVKHEGPAVNPTQPR